MTAQPTHGAERLLELEVGPVAHGGHCVARHEGQVVFVRHALPGERVVAAVTDGAEGSRFLRADAVRVLSASSERVPAPCPHARPGGCGGCDFQHVSLPRQRSLKAEGRPTNNYLFSGANADALMQALDPKSPGPVPYTLVIAPGGKIIYRKSGLIDATELQAKLIEILGPYYK